MIRRLLLVLGLSLLSATSALADSLDGDWCNPIDGKLTVDGSIIITPAGKRVMGDYERHRFTYSAPQGDWNAGSTIVIQQYSEQLMKLTVGGDAASSREWRPCQVIS